ncbi:MFS transporter [Nonomuraea typhae]|uniref:MFS transporter n=1 Tax=Nonomuraea typhae TaxID=2603600 RepID=A0ABW7YQ25_9ACTN
MYVSTIRAPGARRLGRVPSTVVALGLVSFFTDVSAEMVAAFLPMYLLYGVGAGYLHLGVLDGLYTGAGAVLRLAGGHLADRTSRPKAVALAGYALSAGAKLLFPLAGGSLPGVGAAVAVDRAGKGLRTAPRDALITAAAPPRLLSTAFGVHRTLDTAGALLGPVLAFALVAAAGSAYDAVFGVSFCLALVGVLVLACFVRDSRPPPGAGPRVSVRDGWRLLREPSVRRVAVFAACLGLGTAGDAFLFVAVQRQSGLASGALPLLPLATSLVFLAAAVPVGRLADRVGGWRVFLAGHALLALAYLLLGAGGMLPAWPAAAGVLVLHGLFYAATDGVLMACLAPRLPERLRASGLALVQTGQAVARMGGAICFGALAAGQGLPGTFALFCAALAGVLGVAVLRRRT